MPFTNSIAGLLIDSTDAQGLVVQGSIPAFGNLDSTASIYAVGCQLRDASTGVSYKNTGTVLVPKWTQIAQKGGSFSQTIAGAATYSLFNTCPVGFTGTITGVRALANQTGTTVLTFTKNGVLFATMTTSATLGVQVGCPLGTATAGNNVCPIGSVTFGPTDVLNVASASAIIAQVTVDFV